MSQNRWGVPTYEQYSHSPERYERASSTFNRTTDASSSSTGAAPFVFVGAVAAPKNLSILVFDTTKPYAIGQTDDSLILKAIDELKDAVRARLGPASEFSIEQIEDDDESDSVASFIVLYIKAAGLDRQKRHALRTELLRKVAASPSFSVRKRIVVGFR